MVPACRDNRAALVAALFVLGLWKLQISGARFAPFGRIGPIVRNGKGRSISPISARRRMPSNSQPNATRPNGRRLVTC